MSKAAGNYIPKLASDSFALKLNESILFLKLLSFALDSTNVESKLGSISSSCLLLIFFRRHWPWKYLGKVVILDKERNFVDLVEL